MLNEKKINDLINAMSKKLISLATHESLLIKEADMLRKYQTQITREIQEIIISHKRFENFNYNINNLLERTFRDCFEEAVLQFSNEYDVEFIKGKLSITKKKIY